MANVLLKWDLRTEAEAIRVYRDTATFTAGSLPSGGPIATLAGNAVEYEDTAAPDGTYLFYAIAAVKASDSPDKVALSDLVTIYTAPASVASPSPSPSPSPTPSNGLTVPQMTILYQNTRPLFTLPYSIEWDGAHQDDLGAWAASPNPDRLVIPSGVSLVRFRFQWEPEGYTHPSNLALYAELLKNGAGVEGMGVFVNNKNNSAWANNSVFFESGAIDVVSGDYFSVNFNANSSVINQNIGTPRFDYMFLEMEVLG